MVVLKGSLSQRALVQRMGRELLAVMMMILLEIMKMRINLMMMR